MTKKNQTFSWRNARDEELGFHHHGNPTTQVGSSGTKEENRDTSHIDANPSPQQSKRFHGGSQEVLQPEYTGSKYVTVVPDLPNELMESYNFSLSAIPNIRVPAWASAHYYMDVVYPVLQETRVVRISPFANRLASSIPLHIQFLRCLANYKALRFSSTITNLAKMIANRMAYKSLNHGGNIGWLMLRDMGFSSNTPIYLASDRLYKEEIYLQPLRKMFPLLETKWSLTSADELAPIKGYSSRLAALDYMLCLYSEVFVTTQGGNFSYFLMGQRRFVYNGHAKTIMPDKSKLVVLLQNTSISWESFKDEMEMMLAESDCRSIMVPRVKKSKRKGSVYLNPLPECRCLWESHNSTSTSDLF
ncbi:hypothetical protein C2S51_008002 [Perilla frutescens var. frutescens]|nr:hypothetical protein C2S51_008002 [Perilla frutescens var. frutescens]